MTTNGDPKPQPGERVVVEERLSQPDPRPRILMTNDDGINSPGLRALAHVLAEDYDVVVAAPEADVSGAGTGIGRFDPRKGVELRPVDFDGFDGLESYAIAGPPGLAVMAAALGAFGKSPDLVVSGPNGGMNTGHSIIHSGTVGAVLTARTFGSHGLAISLAPSDPWEWQTAIVVARSAVRWVLAQKGSRVVLNVNVPGVPIEEVRGIRWADLDGFGYFRVAMMDVEDEKLQFEVAGSASGLDPASDTALCFDRYVTLTPLSAIEPAPFPSVPAEAIWNGHPVGGAANLPGG
jgi:5'-nucleotidase